MQPNKQHPHSRPCLKYDTLAKKTHEKLKIRIRIRM